ncbi:MAG: hypothetical protein K0M64_05190 [Rhizobium sp.]|nr:hypothetical protein [Rhizobium sp.]
MKRHSILVAAIALALPAFAQAQQVDDVGGQARPAPAAQPKPAPAGAFEKALVNAGVVFDGDDPIMSPRFFRSGTPGDPCSEFSSGDFQYRTYPFMSDGSGSLGVQVNTNSCGFNVYFTIHEAPFNPGNICQNYVWSWGSSDTTFSDSIAVTPNTPMVLVASGVPNAPNVVCGPITFELDGVAKGSLSGAGGNNPVRVAEELVIPPSRTVTNSSNTLDISTALAYSFSPGEVRYARLHCPGSQFAPGTAVTFTGDASNLIGSVNGVGSDAIYFSITAGATPAVADDMLVVNGDRILTAKAPVDCTYGLYDFPSQAQAGGPTGRVATTSGAYIRFAPSYALRVTGEGNPVADVESADPAYSSFVLGAPTFDILRGQVGGFSYGTTAGVLGGDQPITLDGQAIELVDLMDADTALVFTGDFGAASDVYFSTAANCSTNAQSADSFDDTEAVFTIGSNAAFNHFLCYAAGGDPIRASEFTVALAPVSADATTYAVGGRGPLALGAITRNGTELQAPLAQVPANYLSRLVLTNTGSQDRVYEVRVFGETGNVISTANLTGTVPAGGTTVVDLDTMLTGFTAAPRATLNVTVSAPNAQIQGLYQIVNPDSGTLSNHVMVRPGTN